MHRAMAAQNQCTESWLPRTNAQRHGCPEPMHRVMAAQNQCTESWLPRTNAQSHGCPEPMHRDMAAQNQCTESWLPRTNAQRHGCPEPMHRDMAAQNQCTETWLPRTNAQRHGYSHSPRYAGVPTTDFLKLFSPMTLAKPKSHSLAWGMPLSEVSRTFSGFRSQWTMSFLCRY